MQRTHNLPIYALLGLLPYSSRINALLLSLPDVFATVGYASRCWRSMTISTRCLCQVASVGNVTLDISLRSDNGGTRYVLPSARRS